MFNRAQFQDFMKGEFETITGINTTKGHDYAGDEDALANFKLNAERLGLTPEQVWGVYAAKHWAAIETFVKEGDVKSEPIEGRIHDVILYCFLLLGLLKENDPEIEAQMEALGLKPRKTPPMGGSIIYPNPPADEEIKGLVPDDVADARAARDAADREAAK